jgi:solute carrier family 35 protein E1
VSFAHIVKAAEPVFSVLLSWPLLGIVYPWYVWGSLLPIVAGCSLSAMKEVSFSWGGFNNAMISNVGMVLRNIYSKKSLNDYKVRCAGGGREAGGGSEAGLAACPTTHASTHDTRQTHPHPHPRCPHPHLHRQHIDGINLFGLISIVALCYCAPAAVYVEGHAWAAAWDAAVAKMGQSALLQLLAVGGIFYHLYNQVGFFGGGLGGRGAGGGVCWRG